MLQDFLVHASGFLDVGNMLRNSKTKQSQQIMSGPVVLQKSNGKAIEIRSGAERVPTTRIEERYFPGSCGYEYGTAKHFLHRKSDDIRSKTIVLDAFANAENVNI